MKPLETKLHGGRKLNGIAPCPFCKSDKHLWKWVTDNYKAVFCSACKCVGPKCNTQDWAIAMWEKAN